MRRATLDEGGIDLESGSRRRCEVFGGSGGWLFHQRDAVAGQDILVAGREALVGAALAAGADDQLVGRRRLDELRRQPEGRRSPAAATAARWKNMSRQETSLSFSGISPPAVMRRHQHSACTVPQNGMSSSKSLKLPPAGCGAAAGRLPPPPPAPPPLSRGGASLMPSREPSIFISLATISVV
jgi:hypothetical protein